MLSTIPLPKLGDLASYDEVLWWFLRYDFVFKDKVPEAELERGADPALREIRMEILSGKKPFPPPSIPWRYIHITQDIAAACRLTWSPCPLLPEAVRGLVNRTSNIDESGRTEPGVSPLESFLDEGKISYIQELAGGPDCGSAESYQNLILCKMGAFEAYIQTRIKSYLPSFDPNEYVIIEGAHRLCALWVLYNRLGNWPPEVAGFIGG
jgi:hypothetical protein